jgi:hypothetical protein
MSLAALLLCCAFSLQAVINPMYKHAPEEYFHAQLALNVAKAIPHNLG